MNFKRNKAFGSEPVLDNKILTRGTEEFMKVIEQERRGELVIYSLDVLATNGHYAFNVRKIKQNSALLFSGRAV